MHAHLTFNFCIGVVRDDVTLEVCLGSESFQANGTFPGLCWFGIGLNLDHRKKFKYSLKHK